MTLQNEVQSIKQAIQRKEYLSSSEMLSDIRQVAKAYNVSYTSVLKQVSKALPRR